MTLLRALEGLRMLAMYPATYRDRHGEVATTITNDGMRLRMVVRSVELVGESFDFFEPRTSVDGASRAGLRFDGTDLCSCVLECDIPVPVVFGSTTVTGILHMRLELGDPRPEGNRGIDREDLRLTLTE